MRPRPNVSYTTISAASSASSASTVCEPIKPAPPITTNLFPVSSMGRRNDRAGRPGG